MSPLRVDETPERVERDENEHPLESPEALRHDPRDKADEEQGRVPHAGATPDDDAR